MKRAAVQQTMTSKKIAIDVKSEEKPNSPITLNSLPENMFHLEQNIFLLVNEFNGLSRVNIRRFRENEQGILEPTKEGISLHPRIWYIFMDKSTTMFPASKCQVFENDLIFSKVIEEGKTEYVLQRMFRKKNNSLEFVPAFVKLSPDQFLQVCKNESNILNCLNSSVLKYSLSHHIRYELHKNHFHEGMMSEYDDFDTPEGFNEIYQALCKAVCTAITKNICDSLDMIYLRKGEILNQEMHMYMNYSPEERFEEFFPLAFLSIDWKEFAINFVNTNVKMHKFTYFMQSDDLISSLDITKFFKDVKDMYVKDTPNLKWLTS